MSTAEEKSIEKSSSYGISIQSNSLLSLTLQKQKKNGRAKLLLLLVRAKVKSENVTSINEAFYRRNGDACVFG